MVGESENGLHSVLNFPGDDRRPLVIVLQNGDYGGVDVD